ncbi:restriction endonuclease subunit S [Rheinheimera tilapiae]|uniref:Restriction endonuclease subunit S n=1 Tax=Rheinheimera tilapiae TaxID=875043 RepID=A0ABV6BGC5_9GAMM
MSWPMVKIGSCIEKIKSWNPLKSADTDSFLYIDLSSVDKDKKEIDLSSVVSILPSDAPSRARQLVKANDVLVSTVRPNLNGVALVSESFCGATASTGYCVLRANAQKLDSRFLFYWVQTQSFISDMVKKATGANYPAVSDKIIMDSEIPLPPLAEQKRIAAILDKADAIRRKRQQAIQLADDFLRAVFLQMFGDPVTNPKGWEVKPLEFFIKNKNDLVDGPFGSSINTQIDYIEDGEIPVIRTKNVTADGFFNADDLKFMSREKYESVIRSQVLPGDIVLTKVGTIGNVCIFPATFHEAVLSTTGSCRIRLDLSKINKLYFYFYLKFYKPKMLEIASAGVQPFLNMKHIKSFMVPLPNLKIQEDFFAIAEKNMNLKAKLANLANNDLFDALSEKAFSGQL